MKLDASRAVPARPVKTNKGVKLCNSATSGAKIVIRHPRKLPPPYTDTANLLGKRSNVAI